MARILLYGVNFAPETMGIGRYSGELAAWLAARGHEVDAIVAPPHYPAWKTTPGPRGRRFWEERRDGVRVWRAPLYVPPPRRAGAVGRILLESSFAATALRWWAPLFAEARHDVVIAVTPPLQMALYPWLHRLHNGVPFVVHVQDLQVDAAAGLGFFGEGSPLIAGLRRAERALFAAASRVTTISERMRGRIADKGIPEERIGIVRNWCDLERVRPAPRDNALRRRLVGEGDRVLVLYAGSMGEKQGLDDVLAAAERTRSERRLRFVLCGDGVARERLAAQAQARRLDNVTFVEPVAEEELSHLLAAGDIHLVVQKRAVADLVMPSKLGNILAAGRPVLATADADSALGDAIGASGGGRLVPAADPSALADGILALAVDEPLRARLGRAGRSWAERTLDKETILRRFEGELLALAQPAARASARGVSSRGLNRARASSA